MTDKRITADALGFWLKKRGMTQSALAEKTGLAQNYISQMNTGSRPGSLETIQVIADALGVSLPEFFACKDDELPEVEFVPLVKAVPRAGTGGLEVDDEHVRLYSFHSSFLRRKQGTPETMRLFKIDGDSMEKTLFPGDLIMVNTRQVHISTGGIYLIRLEGELMVKRLENRPGGILLIRSDNDRYDDLSVDKNNESLDLEVFGRMVWSCREY